MATRENREQGAVGESSEGKRFPAAVPDVRAMTPAERGRLLSRAVGVKRRLEARHRDGVLTRDQVTELRVARLTLASLDTVDIAVRGIDLPLREALSRRAELRKLLGITGKRRKRLPPPSNRPGGPEKTERELALEELRTIEAALAADAMNEERKPVRVPTRATPRRVTSVVRGGAPGLGSR